MTTAETTTAAVAAPANGNGTTTKTAKQPVRMQFLCEKRQIEFIEEIPASLIGVEAVLKPAMPKMFELTLAPIVMKHASEALAACEDKCSSKGCEKDATTIVATPMSVSLFFLLALAQLLSLSLSVSLYVCILWATRLVGVRAVAPFRIQRRPWVLLHFLPPLPPLPLFTREERSCRRRRRRKKG